MRVTYNSALQILSQETGTAWWNKRNWYRSCTAILSGQPAICWRFPLKSKIVGCGYISKITRTQNLGVSQWRATSCATIGPESYLRGVPRGLGYPESCLGRVLPQSFSYTLPCTVVASFGLRHRDTPHFLLCIYADADEGVSTHTVSRNLFTVIIMFISVVCTP